MMSRVITTKGEGIKTKGEEDSDNEFKNKFATATSGLLQGYAVTPLKILESKSRQNATTIIDYLIAMNEEINPSSLHKRSQIVTLTQLSESCNNKPFLQMTRNDILSYLNKSRKPEDIDPLHKWVGTFNLRRGYLFRFFKWLYNPNIEPGKRPNPPEHVLSNIPKFKRKEKSIYKPTDLWSEEDDSLFLKYCPNKRDKCYHTMSRDLSARPHEILSLKIKDVIFKTNGTQQYAEVLVNGKTGTRHIPLFLSVPYIKDWIDSHPQKNNKNTYLIPALNKHSKNFGSKMNTGPLNAIYRNYKLHFFPSLLNDPKVPEEDKEKISNLLQKPFNPYIRRHSSLTEKSKILKFHTFHQHAGWTPGSQMHLKYTHYFGNESSEELLESYGVETRSKKKDNDNVLRPRICPNCNESNIPNSKFCAKCRMVLTYDAYNETLESEKWKDDKLTSIEKQFNMMQNQVQTLIAALGNANKNEIERNIIARNLYDSELIKEAASVDTDIATTTIDNDEKKRDRLIHEAGKAAYHAATTNSILTKEAKNTTSSKTKPTSKKVIVK
jgi:integrase/recombinase XerD